MSDENYKGPERRSNALEIYVWQAETEQRVRNLVKDVAKLDGTVEKLEEIVQDLRMKNVTSEAAVQGLRAELGAAQKAAAAVVQRLDTLRDDDLEALRTGRREESIGRRDVRIALGLIVAAPLVTVLFEALARVLGGH